MDILLNSLQTVFVCFRKFLIASGHHIGIAGSLQILMSGNARSTILCALADC